ncbi:GNAT family N-acetyltransferase [Alteromonas ponticola]|uniref:GNAT family N-acetyltransferase n=1 Tax=Alteromonas ponticola TaxID=2720613 RepID=A0ABX1R3M9_9ALTE|nr:GNAT family N-acetyltransferase [Alteromonas ponticola]
MAIIIRRVTLDDLHDIHRVETDCFNENGYPLFVFRQFYDLSSRFFFIATVDEQAAGYIYGSDISVNGQAWILSLAVKQVHRGRRIGNQLVQHLIDEYKPTAAKELVLTVAPQNAAALKLYRTHEFEIYGKDNNYFFDHTSRYLLKRTFN